MYVFSCFTNKCKQIPIHVRPSEMRTIVQRRFLKSTYVPPTAGTVLLKHLRKTSTYAYT